MNPDQNQSVLPSQPDPVTQGILQDAALIHYTTTVPTYTGKDGTRELYYDGTTYWLYVYANSGWRKTPLQGANVSKIVAGTNVTISPAGGTGDVTVNATYSMSGGLQTFTLPGNTNVDTAGSVSFSFSPKMVIGISRKDAANAGALGIFIDGAGENVAALPSGAIGTLSQSGSYFIGVSTGTPGLYMRALSVSGTTLNFRYANSNPGDYFIDLWAIG